MTFNIRTLGQLQELTASVIDHNIDIICIHEHRFVRSKDITYHDTVHGWTLVSAYSWKNSVNGMIGGVGMRIGAWALKSLNMIKKIQRRLILATFNDNPKATIKSCYSPTNVSEEIDLIASYKSYPPLFVAFRNTTFSPSAET